MNAERLSKVADELTRRGVSGDLYACVRRVAVGVGDRHDVRVVRGIMRAYKPDTKHEDTVQWLAIAALTHYLPRARAQAIHVLRTRAARRAGRTSATGWL